MSANLEWEIPFTIRSTYGDLDLNVETSLGHFLLDPQTCTATRPLRATIDEVPQGDGSIPHMRFAGGYQVELAIMLWASRDEPACAEQARLMAEALGLHLNRMLNDTGRVLWTPTGLGDERMLDEARILEVSPWTLGQAGEPRLTVLFDSPFPYVIDATQTITSLLDGVPQVLTHEGNVEMFPVVKVYGAATAFTITNDAAGESLVYDSALPGAVAIGGGDYIEFDFFRNTAYLNGAGGSRKAGIDIEASDFWALHPTANTVEITGADADVLWNHSYA